MDFGLNPSVSGSLVANDQAQLTLIFASERLTGAACTPQNLGYKTYPCNSTSSFIAKKR